MILARFSKKRGASQDPIRCLHCTTSKQVDSKSLSSLSQVNYISLKVNRSIHHQIISFETTITVALSIVYQACKMNHMKIFRVTIFLLLGVLCNTSFGFVLQDHSNRHLHSVTRSAANDPKSVDSDEVIARRIVVSGDVQGGYYRSCVRNEVRFVDVYKLCDA